MPPVITVLSPHRDDAVFSVGAFIYGCIRLMLPVSVYNFYTISGYAPWIATGGNVTARRAFEDRQAIRSISPDICLRSCRFQDAPLRLDLGVQSVMQQDERAIRRCDVEQIRRVLHRVPKNSFVIAPLGLGGHIDHLTVLQAALDTVPPHRLAFYEDLPYAAWTPRQQVIQRVERVSRSPLQHVVLISNLKRAKKNRWISHYRSQVKREEAVLIANYTPEGIWMPKRAARELLRMATHAPPSFQQE